MAHEVRRVAAVLRPGGVAHRRRQHDLGRVRIDLQRALPGGDRLALAGQRASSRRTSCPTGRSRPARPRKPSVSASSARRASRRPFTTASRPMLMRLIRRAGSAAGWRARLVLRHGDVAGQVTQCVLGGLGITLPQVEQRQVLLAKGRHGLSGSASAFSRAASCDGLAVSSWCCAHSRLARSRNSGSTELSAATWFHRAAAPARLPASASSAASCSRASVR